MGPRSNWALRASVVAAAVTLAGCSDGAVNPTSKSSPTEGLSRVIAGGPAPGCRTTTLTTEAVVLGSPQTTTVELIATMTNHGTVGCAVPQPESACLSDPSVEVMTSNGAIVWSPANLAIPCPARLPGQPPLVVNPGQSIDTRVTWDLTVCGPAAGCSMARAAPGRYTALGISDSVSNARGVSFTIS